jgi:glutamate synthase (NADPH/NADH) large chain/glutamate synthase (ferredoxin)
MADRGAMDADAKTGDGSGVMTQIPYKLFRTQFFSNPLFENGTKE